MATINDGGPAFPLPFHVQANGLVSAVPDSGLCGMSLRDYFAAHIIGGIASAVLLAERDIDGALVASDVWKLADAMLSARAKEQS